MFRSLFGKTRFAERQALAGKHIIVTGASPGSLGYATATRLAAWGAKVILTTRKTSGEAVEQLVQDAQALGITAQAHGHDLDLSDAASVKRFLSWYLSQHGERLDVLINNAGVHLDLLSQWKTPRLSSDGQEIQLRTNYWGTAHLTHGLLPLLLQTGQRYGDARIVNVVSQLHSRGSNQALFDPDTTYESWKFYGLSKLALIHFSMELQRRYAQTHKLQAYCLHPGGKTGSYTDIANKGLAGHRTLALIRQLAAPFERWLMSTPEEGAQTQIHCATAPELPGGHYYVNCRVAQASADALDATAAGRLWDETQAWLNTHSKHEISA